MCPAKNNFGESMCLFGVLPSSGDSVEVVKGGIVVEGEAVAHPTWELMQLGQLASDWNWQEANSQQLKSP